MLKAAILYGRFRKTKKIWEPDNVENVEKSHVSMERLGPGLVGGYGSSNLSV